MQEQIKWVSEDVKRITLNNIPLDEIINKRYNQQDVLSFAADRSLRNLPEDYKMLTELLGKDVVFYTTGLQVLAEKNPRMLQKINDEQTNEYTQKQSIKLEGGRAESDITAGVLLSSGLDNGFIKIGYLEPKNIDKKNRTQNLDNIELIISNILKGDQKANFVRITNNGTSLDVEPLKENSLYSDAYYGEVPKDIITARFMKLIAEAAHITYTLTNEIPKETIHRAKQEKIAEINKKREISDEEALSSYHTYKIINAFNLSEEFKELFLPIQTGMNNYENNHTVIISDRSPKNRKEKNFDGNKIDQAPFTRELTLILDCVPGYFNLEERANLERFASICYNKTSDELEQDLEYQASNHGERFTRSVLNANHCIKEAERIYNTKGGTPFFFEYAKKLSDAKVHYQMAEDSMKVLNKNSALAEDDALEVIAMIKESFSNKLRFVNENDYKIDLELYNKISRPWIAESEGQRVNPIYRDISQKPMTIKQLEDGLKYTKNP